MLPCASSSDGEIAVLEPDLAVRGRRARVSPMPSIQETAPPDCGGGDAAASEGLAQEYCAREAAPGGSGGCGVRQAVWGRFRASVAAPTRGDRALIGAGKHGDVAVALDGAPPFRRRTRLRLSARIWPLKRLMPETRTSAFGASPPPCRPDRAPTMSRMRHGGAVLGALDLRAADFDACAGCRNSPRSRRRAKASRRRVEMGPLPSRHHRADAAEQQKPEHDARPDADPAQDAPIARRGGAGRPPHTDYRQSVRRGEP